MASDCIDEGLEAEPIVDCDKSAFEKLHSPPENLLMVKENEYHIFTKA
jgi:hypothetical protein